MKLSDAEARQLLERMMEQQGTPIRLSSLPFEQQCILILSVDAVVKAFESLGYEITKKPKVLQ